MKIFTTMGAVRVDLNRFPLSSIRETAEIQKTTLTESRQIRRQARQFCLRSLTDLVCFTGWLETQGKQRDPTVPNTSQNAFRVYEKHPGSSMNEKLVSACTDNMHVNEVVPVRETPNQS